MRSSYCCSDVFSSYLLLHLFGFSLVHRSGPAPNSYIVDKHIGPAEAIDDLLDQPAHVTFLRDIAHYGDCSDFVRKGAGISTGSNANIRASVNKTTRGCGPNAAGSSRNDRDFILN